MNYANAGIPVLLKETDQAALDRGLATIRKNYDISAAKGKMTAEQVDRVMSLIRPTLTYDGFDQVDIVVEAVFENSRSEEVRLRRSGTRHAAGLRAGLQHLDARYRSIRASRAAGRRT